MKTKLNEKQKSEVVAGARMAAARPAGDAFAQFWAEMTSNDPAVHGKRIAKPALIRSKHH